MKVIDLKRINEAPEKGLLLAYLRDKIMFERYDAIESAMKMVADKIILELHLFDSEKEYRALSSTSRRFPDGNIEDVIDIPFADDCADCFNTEAVLTGEVISKITVINHLDYDENGSIRISNYRLVGEV